MWLNGKRKILLIAFLLLLCNFPVISSAAITIVASGDQSYYTGENVGFSGTTSCRQAPSSVRLVLTGGGFPSSGVTIATDRQVLADNTWSYRWTVPSSVGGYTISSGTYSIYAYDSCNAYGTVPINLKKGFISMTSSQSTYSPGDNIIMLGTATGNSRGLVNIWIFGNNYIKCDSVPVQSDASFKYVVGGQDFSQGEYVVVGVHPGSDGVFVASCYNVNSYEELLSLVNQDTNDDTYTKLKLLIESPGGSLSITSSPSGASVYVDGSYQGTTPTSLSGQTTGSHTIRLTKSGYNDYSTSSTVYAGQTTTVTGYLNPITPVPTTPKTGTSTPQVNTPTAPPTVVPTTPRTMDRSNSGNSNFTLPIIGILALLFLAGGGYAIYRMKKTPSSDQTPLMEVEEHGREPLSSTVSSSEVQVSESAKDLLNRITSVEQKALVLSILYSPVQLLLAKAREQHRSGAYNAVRVTLKNAEDAVTFLAQYETRLKQWKREGYITTPLESLNTDNINTINTAFRDFEQDLVTLKQHERHVQELKRSNNTGNVDPSISQCIESIETQLHDPRNIPEIEREIEALRQLQGKQKNIEQTIRSQVEKVQREAGSPAIKQEIAPIIKSIRQHDIPSAQELLEDLAGQQLAQVNTALDALRTAGTIVSLTSDPIREQIAAQHYGDAIIDSEKMIAELTRIQETYAKAKVLIRAVTEPEIIILFDKGNYGEFIRTVEDRKNLLKKITERKEQGNKLLSEAEGFGNVPETIRVKLQAQDEPTIESAIEEIEMLRATAKPELTLSLDRTQLSTERWHKLGITLTNTGLAHVENVTFAFSSEFETKGIKPISVKAGQSSRTDISIIPKNVGNILLEITLAYKDSKGREYKKVQEFWIDVVEKGMTTIPHSETPSSPVSQFTPKPLTPKQLPPELSDRYTESEFIGKGGFARVFKAKRKDGKYVAVKVPISLDASTGKSFIAEMQNWTKLSHQNIVRLYDFNIMPMPFFEEELCDNALADQNKPIESEEAAWILFNICEGLKFAHAQKIIHRDLKPQNILLKNGVPKISDWGLSRIISVTTTTSAMSFTPYYAAPEQIGNKVKDERTDIWQLGVIMYELITGELPFKGDSMIEIGMNIATKDPKRPSEIKSDVKVIDAVVMKCLEKDPKNRYQSVLELQKDLAMYLRKNYADLLKTSVSVQDFTRSASYCGDLVMINMLTGDIPTAYKYLLDFVQYSKGDVKAEALELSEQIKMRMEEGVTEIPDELIQKAEILVHQVSVGFKKKG